LLPPRRGLLDKTPEGRGNFFSKSELRLKPF
jgi:hypothetical protein